MFQAVPILTKPAAIQRLVYRTAGSKRAGYHAKMVYRQNTQLSNVCAGKGSRNHLNFAGESAAANTPQG